MRMLLLSLLAFCACRKTEDPPKPESAETACVEGTAADCHQAGMTWTGTQCCTKETMTCVAGANAECHQGGGKWTGAKCCLSGKKTCVDGNAADCHRSGSTWTGTQCCVK